MLTKKFIKIKKKIFTLIELIIVVAIISILVASSTLILTNRLSKARDSKRISDLSLVKTSLEILSLSNVLPVPDKYISILGSGNSVLWYQGKLGENTVKELRSINKIPIDPTGVEYDYSITNDKSKYQVASLLENKLDKISFLNSSRVYAKSDFFPKIFSNYNSQFLIEKNNKGYVLWNMPSLFYFSGNQLKNGYANIYNESHSINTKFKIIGFDINNYFNETSDKEILYNDLINKFELINSHQDVDNHINKSILIYSNNNNNNSELCENDYFRNDQSQQCESKTRQSNCEGLPENAGWNVVDSITQNWDESQNIRLPTNIGQYDGNLSTSECKFTCNSGYLRNTATNSCEKEVINADIFVSKKGLNNTTCGTIDFPCLTIGYGISRASAGQTIYVFSGTYSEYVNITKSDITILGESPDTTYIVRGLSVSTDTININASGVTIQGFTIINDAGYFGVNIVGNNATIINNIIKGVGGGVYTYEALGVSVINNTIIGASSASGRGAIGSYKGYFTNIINNIIYGNAKGINFATTVVKVDNKGNNTFYTNGTNYTNYTLGNGDIIEDPLFVDYSMMNLKLQNNSHAIDSGFGLITDYFGLNNTYTQQSGVVDTGTIDRGAHFFKF